jgi:hypothetical protein
MLVDSLFVGSVDLRRLGGSASGYDSLAIASTSARLRPVRKNSCPLARKGARNSTTDGTTGSVDHGNFVLEHHLCFLSLDEFRSAEAHLRAAELFAIPSISGSSEPSMK